MKLQLRLSLLVSTLIILVSAAIGTFAITTSYDQQLSTYDGNIDEIIAQIDSSNEDPLSLATFLLEQSSFKFSIALVTASGELVVVDETAGELTGSPDPSQLIQATKEAIGLSGMRLRTLSLADEEFLAIGYSTDAIDKNLSENILYLGIFTLLVLLISISLSFWLFRADAQLNRAATALQDSQNRMREFLGDAAHELRTPLTIIRGYFELLRRGENDKERQRSHEERIESEIARMQSLIEELLLVAELDSKPASDLLETDLGELLEAEVSTLVALEPKRLVTSQIDGGLNVAMERENGKRLLANIFSNFNGGVGWCVSA